MDYNDINQEISTKYDQLIIGIGIGMLVILLINKYIFRDEGEDNISS